MFKTFLNCLNFTNVQERFKNCTESFPGVVGFPYEYTTTFYDWNRIVLN